MALNQYITFQSLSVKITICLFFLLFYSLPVKVEAEALPDLGNPNRLALTATEENEMSEQFMGQLYAMNLILEDPIATDYLQNLGNQLVKSSTTPKQPFHFFILNDPAINAFAGPGGNIGVNAGLILTTDSESELASVIAHELAHVTQGHLASQIAEMSRANKLSLAGMAGAIALSLINPVAATAAMATTMAGAQQHALNFSRSQEKEADRVGIKTLTKAGHNPNSMIDFFKKLQREESISIYNEIPELLRTHPITEERISDAQHRIQISDNYKKTNSLLYYQVKVRLRLLLAKDPHALLTYFEKSLQNNRFENKDAMEYGYGITLLATQQPKKGFTLLEQLAKKHPNDLIFNLGYAQAAIVNENRTLALKVLENLNQLHPRHYPVMYAYGETLIENNQPVKAIEILQRFILDNPDVKKPFGLLAKAQAKNGQMVQAYQNRANYYLSHNAPELAIEQLNIALTLPNLDKSAHQRIKAKIEALQSEMQG